MGEGERRGCSRAPTARGNVYAYSWASPPEILLSSVKVRSVTKGEGKSGCQGWATNDFTTLGCFLTGTSEKSPFVLQLALGVKSKTRNGEDGDSYGNWASGRRGDTP